MITPTRQRIDQKSRALPGPHHIMRRTKSTAAFTTDTRTSPTFEQRYRRKKKGKRQGKGMSAGTAMELHAGEESQRRVTNKYPIFRQGGNRRPMQDQYNLPRTGMGKTRGAKTQYAKHGKKSTVRHHDSQTAEPLLPTYHRKKTP